MANSNQVIEEIEGILEEYNILKRGFEPLRYLGMLGKDAEEISESDRLITKIKTLISENCGIESEYYKSLERESRQRGRNYLNQCISVLNAFYERLIKKNIPKVSMRMKANKAINEKETNKRAIFVVHGRNEHIRKAMFDFLRAIHLEPIEWEEAIKMTGKTSPYIGEILTTTFSKAQAILVIFTPDDLTKLNPLFQKEDDPSYEKELTGQARPNVLFEAGIGIGGHPDRTILVQIGNVKPFSDIAGRYIIKFKGSPQDRKKLANRLESAGCDVNLEGIDWLITGDFIIREIDNSDSEEEQKSEDINEIKKKKIQGLYDEFTDIIIRLYKSKASTSNIFAQKIHNSLEMQEYLGITARRPTQPGHPLDNEPIFFLYKLFKLIPNSANFGFDPDRTSKYGNLLKKDSAPDTIKNVLTRFFNQVIKFVKEEFDTELEIKENISI